MLITAKAFPQSSHVQSCGEFCAAREAPSKAAVVVPEPGVPLEPLLEARPDDLETGGGSTASYNCPTVAPVPEAPWDAHMKEHSSAQGGRIPAGFPEPGAPLEPFSPGTD